MKYTVKAVIGMHEVKIATVTSQKQADKIAESARMKYSCVYIQTSNGHYLAR